MGFVESAQGLQNFLVGIFIGIIRRRTAVAAVIMFPRDFPYNLFGCIRCLRCAPGGCKYLLMSFGQGQIGTETTAIYTAPGACQEFAKRVSRPSITGVCL